MTAVVTCVSESDSPCLDRPDAGKPALCPPPASAWPGLLVRAGPSGLCVQDRGGPCRPAPCGPSRVREACRRAPTAPSLPELCAVRGELVAAPDRGHGARPGARGAARRTRAQGVRLHAPGRRPHKPLGTAPGHVCSCHRTQVGQAHPAAARRRNSILPGPGKHLSTPPRASLTPSPAGLTVCERGPTSGGRQARRIRRGGTLGPAPRTRRACVLHQPALPGVFPSLPTQFTRRLHKPRPEFSNEEPASRPPNFFPLINVRTAVFHLPIIHPHVSPSRMTLLSPERSRGSSVPPPSARSSHLGTCAGNGYTTVSVSSLALERNRIFFFYIKNSSAKYVFS